MDRHAVCAFDGGSNDNFFSLDGWGASPSQTALYLLFDNAISVPRFTCHDSPFNIALLPAVIRAHFVQANMRELMANSPTWNFRGQDSRYDMAWCSCKSRRDWQYCRSWRRISPVLRSSLFSLDVDLGFFEHMPMQQTATCRLKQHLVCAATFFIGAPKAKLSFRHGHKCRLQPPTSPSFLVAQSFLCCDLKNRGSDGGRATLLLLDRADDPLSPLMHEFTYQCLVEDLLDIEVMIMICRARKVAFIPSAPCSCGCCQLVSSYVGNPFEDEPRGHRNIAATYHASVDTNGFPMH